MGLAVPPPPRIPVIPFGGVAGMKTLSILAAATLTALAACSSPSPLSGVLDSPGPAPDRADKLHLYAFLVGHWDTRIVAFDEDGTRHESRGEIHADWVLEGRAIQ